MAQQLYRQKELPAIFHAHGYFSPLGKHEIPYFALALSSVLHYYQHTIFINSDEP